MNFPRGTKKRKQADSLDGERSLYASFSHAANAVSQLYTAAVQQTKRAEEAGARQALVSKAKFAALPAAAPPGCGFKSHQRCSGTEVQARLR